MKNLVKFLFQLKRVVARLERCGEWASYPKEQGFLTDVPIYESHKRGRNWLAKIERDPRSPGGLARTFMEVGRDSYFYDVSGLERGDVMEIGADYYTSSGNPSRNRLYWVVLENRPDELIVEEFDSPGSAFKFRETLFSDVVKQLEELKRKKEFLLKELEQVEKKITELEAGRAEERTAQEHIEVRRLMDQKRRIEREIELVEDKIEKLLMKYPFLETKID